MKKYDVAVIGSGPGGYPAAIRAAQLGAKTVIIEKEALGGTCLNWGCIPTKTLIASADLYHRATHSKDLGLECKSMSFDYKKMAERKDDVVSKLQGGVGMLIKSNGIDVIQGTASFAGRNKIKVGNWKLETGNSSKKEISIETDATIIATGSTSIMPSFLPKSKRVLDSRMFLDLKKLPETLIVLGGGVIGCEFACMAAQLGTSVTVVEMLEDILFVLDPDIRKEIRRQMESIGITVLTGTAMKDIRADKTGVSCKVGSRKLQADMLLASIGRRPVTEGLALENAGIATTESGAIETDEYCQTRTAGIFAVGDVTAGSTQLAHAATSQGITAAENAVLRNRRKAENIVPACLFTVPEAGVVGLSEQDARERGIGVKTGKFAMTGLGKAMAAGETDGFVKWLTDPETDQLLGAAAVGAHATELIQEAAIAIRAELTAEEVGASIHCHPTFSESWMEAAHATHGTCIHQPAKRRK